MIEKRKFIRHSIEVPIRINYIDTVLDINTNDISDGGLLFYSEIDFPVNKHIKIDIPSVLNNGEVIVEAVVVRCTYLEDENRYEIGVSFFNSKDIMKIRMVEQIIEIDKYRKNNNFSDFEKAATVWIHKYSHNFPKIG